MNRVSVLSAIVLALFAAGTCHAENLVIKYRSGKTQTVVLDEPGQGISSWQFDGKTAPQQQPQKMEESLVPPAQEQVKKEQAQDDKKLTEKAPEKKSGIRVKWNAKPIAD